MNQNQKSLNTQAFLDIIKRTYHREKLFQEYGEKGFDTFTGFLDWEFLELNEVVKEELKLFETAQTILFENSSNELLELYGLDKKDGYNERIEKLTNNVKVKIDSENLIQRYPEIEILFSIVAGLYLEHFDTEFVT